MDHHERCCTRHQHMECFLDVCLLLLLHETTGYGYGLIEQLTDFGFSEDDLNVSTLYRSLRKMEGEGLVTSRWKKGGPGPKRRIYSITDIGEKELAQWIQIFMKRKAHIEKLIGRYEAAEASESEEGQ